MATVSFEMRDYAGQNLYSPSSISSFSFTVEPPPKKEWSTTTVAARSFLLVFTFAFLVAGVAIIYLSSGAHNAYGKYQIYLEQGFASSPALQIFSGVVTTMVAVLGFFAVSKLHFCTLLTYGTLMGCLLIFTVSGTIVSYIDTSQVESYLRVKMLESIDNYNDTDQGYHSIVHLWDTIQSEMECCGVNNYRDWTNRTILSWSIPPASCCKYEANCTRHTIFLWPCLLPETDGSVHCPVYKNGCFPIVELVVEGALNSVGNMGSAVIFLQVVGMFGSCWMAKRVRNGLLYRPQ